MPQLPYYHPTRHPLLVEGLNGRMRRVSQEIMRDGLRTYSNLQSEAATKNYLRSQLEKRMGNFNKTAVENFNHVTDVLGKNGNNIFDVSQLARFFSNTEVDDIEVDNIDSPFPAFYLHFGASANLNISSRPGLYIEGAYVVPSEIDGSTPTRELVFCCNYIDPGPAANVAELVGAQSWIARAPLISGFTVSESIELIDGLNGRSEIANDDQLVTNALRIAVNSLLYISTPKADVEVGFEPEAPRGYVEKIARGDTKMADLLQRRGFKSVRLYGRNISAELALHESSSRNVEPHYRRGHWRRVAHGVGRTERHWHWIAPVIVNGKLGLPARDGTIYELPDEPARPAAPSFKM
ncbi:hypothetical protein [Rhizobium sp. BK176]|uniref:hypothetical protein n=1 Tax=Rhizobium sp. BK176 TaxID=2587071 RepID=UPI0021677EDD|nr:hypothetical protein [Rhizobium sp. BK176]MCS4088552.1 hypothetical protein [Rhizobium sp. BK176]